VTTDKQGNILTILRFSSELGVHYGYNPESRRTKHFYEPANIFVHPMYSLLEVLDWGPLQPNLERTSVDIVWGLPPADPPDDFSTDLMISAIYRDHVYDVDGKLTCYKFDGEFGRFVSFNLSHAGIRDRSIHWNCLDNKIKFK
jgi:hypothetical protein